MKIKSLVVISFQFIAFFLQLSAKASNPGYNYYCFTEKYKIITSSSYKEGISDLIYYSYNDTTSESFEDDWDIKLTNGRSYYKTKNKLIMTWKNGTDYIYQVTINGPHDVEGIGRPSSGNIVVKHRGKVIIRQPCHRLSSGDAY